MHRSRATERHETEFAGVVAAFDRNDPKRLGHRVIDHIDNACGGRLDVETKRLGKFLGNRGARGGGLYRQPPREHRLRVEVAKDQVAVGHRRLDAALAVADGTRFRPGAARTDAQGPAGIDPGDAAAAGADFRQVDDRHADRVAGAMHPAVHVAVAADLVLRSRLDRAILDQAGFCRRPAHVEGDQVGLVELAADQRRGDDARRRPGLDRHRRHFQPFFHVEDTAARAHDVEVRQSHAGHRFLQPSQIGLQDRPDIAAHGRRAGPLELADFRQNLARKEHRNVRQRRTQPFAQNAFMGIVQEGIEKRDGDRLYFVLPDERDDTVDFGLIKRDHDLARRIEALSHLQPAMARHQDAGRVLEKVVKVRSRRAAQLQYVAKAARRHQHRAGALPFQDGVGHDRRRMRQQRHVACFDTVFSQGDLESLHHAFAEIAWRRRHLGDADLSIRFVDQGDIGKSTADIHADPPAHAL